MVVDGLDKLSVTSRKMHLLALFDRSESRGCEQVGPRDTMSGHLDTIHPNDRGNDLVFLGADFGHWNTHGGRQFGKTNRNITQNAPSHRLTFSDSQSRESNGPSGPSTISLGHTLWAPDRNN